MNSGVATVVASMIIQPILRRVGRTATAFNAALCTRALTVSHDDRFAKK